MDKELCPKCGAELLISAGRYGSFKQGEDTEIPRGKTCFYYCPECEKE